MTLDTPLSDLGRYGKGLAGRFKRIGVRTVGDLLYHAPLRYDDLSNVSTIADARVGETVTIRATVELIANRRSPQKRMMLTEGVLSDETGKMLSIWFRQPYLAKTLRPGMKASFAGRVSNDYGRLHLVNPVYELSESSVHTGRMVPVYPATASLTQKHIRAMVHLALPALEGLVDTLPEEIQRTHHLIPLAAALREIHYPTSQSALLTARRRLQFDELLLHQLLASRIRSEVRTAPAVAIPFDENATKAFVGSLPFSLTDDQRKAAWVILQDMAKGEPMHRLLDGDVGSGKTVVAAIAAVNASSAKSQTAIMAPTEVLAKQHYETFTKILPNQKLKLVTNSYQLGVEDIKDAAIVIGTHALIEGTVHMPNLALAVIDEQHRFGVDQRKELQGKRTDGKLPHLLSMTATPIPRTLQLALYGDLDISVLKSKPANRLTVITSVLNERDREKAYTAVRTEVKAGRQAFVVCPLIDPSDTLGAKSAKETCERLKNTVFSDLAVGLLHGKLKAGEKEAVMSDFLSKKIDVLVATAVIEVGIDVPNATVMLIEGAERFGLAQLHQFRGRVGRNELQSWCFAIAEGGIIPARLRAFADCNDGFELAERDLELRGPGELFGVRQSGLDELKFATLSDATLLSEVQEAAHTLVAEDPALVTVPLLAQRLRRHEERIHLE